MASAIRLASGPLKEIRLHLCQKGQSSAGVRAFIETHYVPLKQANPKFPILIRECSGIMPKVWARYDFGKESSFDLENKTADDVLRTISNIANAKK